MTMGDRIKYLREKHNMTQDELGELLGVQKSAIRKYEKGSVENIKRTSIKKMSEHFGVSPAWLMGFDGEQQNETTFTVSSDLQELCGLIEQLDAVDRAEIKGTVKQMLKSEKYAGEKANLA